MAPVTPGSISASLPALCAPTNRNRLVAPSSSDSWPCAFNGSPKDPARTARFHQIHSNQTHSNQQELTIMNKDQIKGRLKKTKGKIKAAAGKLVGNKKVETEGEIGEVAGTVQAAYGDLKSDINKKP